MTIISTIAGQNPLGRNGVAIIVNQKVRNAVLVCNLKNDRMISVHFQGNSFNIMVIQAYAPTSNTKEAEVEQSYEDLQELLELTPPKDPHPQCMRKLSSRKAVLGVKKIGDHC